MYKAFYGLSASPFSVNPDPRFLLFTPQLREALACLCYGVQSRRGFILLTGEVGTGKTTLLNKFLEWLHQQHIASAFVFNPRLTVGEFLDYVVGDFGIACPSTQKNSVLHALNQWLLARHKNGQTAVLVIDEAQNLSDELLEEIRLLTNLETATQKLLQIVISGQPELEEKLKDPRVRQLRQRITIRCRTHPLTLEETHSYVAHRLRLAGANGRAIFTPEAVVKLYEYSQGIPRVINLLGDHALIGGYADQKVSISPEAVDEIAREFELHEVSPIVRPGESSGESVRLLEALKTLANLRDQLASGVSGIGKGNK
jgi:type II secretory pathway predicted ATPase ExeA